MKNIIFIGLIFSLNISIQAQNGNSAIDGTLTIGSNNSQNNRELLIVDSDNDNDAIIEMNAGNNVLILGTNASNGGILGTTKPENLTFRTDNITRMTMTSGGRIGVNDTSPDATLWVNRQIDSAPYTFGAIGTNNSGLVVYPNGGVRVGIINGAAGDPGANDLEVQNSINTVNGNITAGSWFGSGVTNPQAPFHGLFNGTANVPRIMAILESPVSKRPVLLFSEGGTALSNGMSIEYNGIPNGAENEMYINGSTGNPLFTFTNGGRLGVNETNPNSNLFVKQVGSSVSGLTLENNGDGDDQWSFEIGTNDLNVRYDGALVGFFDEADGSYSTSSDVRLKHDINPIKNVLDKILVLSPSEYYYKRNKDNNKKSVGFIAQDLLRVFPELVSGEDENFYAINYAGMSTFLVKAVQEQQEIIEAQKIEIDELRKVTERNAALIEALSNRMK